MRPAYGIYISDVSFIDYNKNLLNPNNRNDYIPAEESLISCRLTLELNSAGSCKFIVPPTHPYYNDFTPLATNVTIVEIDNVLWFGRVVSTEVDFYKKKTVTCEGPLAFFNDSILPFHVMYDATPEIALRKALDFHNAQVPVNRQISPGEITYTSNEPATTIEFGYESTMDYIQDKILGENPQSFIYLFLTNSGGISLSWIDNRGTWSGQNIAYGDNLLDLSTEVDASDDVKQILPMGANVNVKIVSKNEHGATIYDEETHEIKYEIVSLPLRLDYTLLSVSEGEPAQYSMPSNPIPSNEAYIAIPGKTYGSTRVVYFDEADSIAKLRSLATAWVGRYDTDNKTINIKAADLRFLDPSNGYFYLGLHVMCSSYIHGLSEEFIITGMDVDVMRVEKTIVLGKLPKKKLSDVVGRSKASHTEEGEVVVVSNDTDLPSGTTVPSSNDRIYAVKKTNENDPLIQLVQSVNDLPVGWETKNTIYVMRTVTEET